MELIDALIGLISKAALDEGAEGDEGGGGDGGGGDGGGDCEGGGAAGGAATVTGGRGGREEMGLDTGGWPPAVVPFTVTSDRARKRLEPGRYTVTADPLRGVEHVTTCGPTSAGAVMRPHSPRLIAGGELT